MRSALRSVVVLVVASLLAAVGPGRAAADDRPGGVGQPAAASAPAEDWIEVIVDRCAIFAPKSPGRPDSLHAWRQLLSLAVCAQDASVPEVSEVARLEPMADEMSRRLAVPMLIYLDALEHGPVSIQLRATFQIGMAYVALSTRARSTIPAPGGPADTTGARRYRELHERLEPLLGPGRRAAFLAFRAIVEAAALDPGLATNVVERHMIATARRMLPLLADAAGEGGATVAAAR